MKLIFKLISSQILILCFCLIGFAHNFGGIGDVSNYCNVESADNMDKIINKLNKLDDQRTPLMEAVIHQDIEQVKKLIEEDVNVNAQDRHGNTALMYAVNMENLEIIKLLINNRADVTIQRTNDGWTPLMEATGIYNNKIEIMQLLIDSGANINVQDSLGYTPLMWATLQEDLEAVKLLVNSGADISIENNRGDTAIDLAITYESNDIADYLTDMLNNK